MAIWAYLLFGFAAGAMLPFQFGINAQLAHWLDSPLRATLVSFAVGTLALLAVALVFVRGLPAGDRVSDAPWWVWVGGFLGAFYVLGSVVAAPKLGAATLVAVILAGQAVASLLVDHFGWVGFAEREITAGRVAGVALVAAVMWLISPIYRTPRDFSAAFRAVAYAAVPVWFAGIVLAAPLQDFPLFTIILLIGLMHALYLFYAGLHHVARVPRGEAAECAGVVVLASFFVSTVVGYYGSAAGLLPKIG